MLLIIHEVFQWCFLSVKGGYRCHNKSITKMQKKKNLLQHFLSVSKPEHFGLFFSHRKLLLCFPETWSFGFYSQRSGMELIKVMWILH